MARMKTFLIYLLLIIVFFIFSQVMIYISINTTYQYKNVEIKSIIPIEVEVQATSINGFAKGNIKNDKDENIEDKYLEIKCYSKHDILMGTKYIKIDKINAKEEKEFEVRFNYNKVDKVVLNIVDEKIVEEKNATQEDKQSDPDRGLATMIAALILLYFI